MNKLVGLLLLACVLLSPVQAHAWDLFRSENSQTRRGNELLGKGKSDEALAEYDAAAKRLPGDPGVEHNRGLALAKAGKYDEAREAFEKVAKGNAPKELRASANYELGRSYIAQAEAAQKANELDKAQGFLREAVDAFKGSLRDGPGNRNAAFNLELARRQLVEVEKKQEEKKKQDDQKKQEEKNKQDEQKQDEQKQDEQKQDGQQDQKSDESQKQPSENQKPNEKPEDKNGDGKPDDAQSEPKNEPAKDAQNKQEPQPPKQDPSKANQPNQQPQNGRGDAAEPLPTDKARELPEHMKKALDALREGEENLEKFRARQRAAQRPRRVEKDW